MHAIGQLPIFRPAARLCEDVCSQKFISRALRPRIGGRPAPVLYGLPVASIDVPLPTLVACMVYKDIVHSVYVAMEVAHLQELPLSCIVVSIAYSCLTH